MKEVGGGLEVVVYGSKTTPKTTLPQITELEKKILIKINEKPGITRKEIAKDLDISLNTVKEYISKMKKKNLISRIGSSRNGYWKVEVELND